MKRIILVLAILIVVGVKEAQANDYWAGCFGTQTDTFYTLHGEFKVLKSLVMQSFGRDFASDKMSIIYQHDHLQLRLHDGLLLELWLVDNDLMTLEYPSFWFRYLPNEKNVVLSKKVRLSKFKRQYDKEWQRFEKEYGKKKDEIKGGQR
ncbi:MAG: hypothetical protein WC623_24045 [Pedobacter sp.]|uniref:hypothetical protein n=1 Tax=Pedobacter sp. TaxID=1411316 RepID=UPI0035626AC0